MTLGDGVSGSFSWNYGNSLLALFLEFIFCTSYSDNGLHESSFKRIIKFVIRYDISSTDKEEERHDLREPC